MISVVLVAIFVCLTAGCGNQTAPPPMPQSENPSSKEISAATDNTFEMALTNCDQDKLVVESINGGKCAVNAQLAADWIASYQAGQSASLAIYCDGEGFPSSLYLLESDGSKTYTISYYSGENPTDHKVFYSDVVIERALDYVFGAGSELGPAPIVHKKEIAGQGITTAVLESPKAEQTAEMIFDALPGNSFCNSAYLPAAIPLSESMNFIYRATGTAEISGVSCILVSAFSSKEELAMGEESGNVLAVSNDHSLGFAKDVAHGGWIFLWDANEKAIQPGS